MEALSTAESDNCIGESLQPGPATYTFERIEDQLRIDTFTNDAGSSQAFPAPFTCESLQHSFKDGVHHYYPKDKQDRLRDELCRRLHDAVIDPKDHISRLDITFSEIVQCSFQLSDQPRDILKDAFQLLRRLPATPLELPDSGSALDPIFAKDYALPGESPRVPKWNGLRVVSYMTTNVIRTALVVLIYRGSTRGTMLDDLINTTADLLSIASRLSLSVSSERERGRWFLVRAFLWTSWQRCVMLYFYSCVGSHIANGFNDHNAESLVFRGFYPAPGVSIQEMSKEYAAKSKPNYMCGWAFELLRIDPCAIGLDFRRFHKRFSMAFGDPAGRCMSGKEASCDGDEPDKCQRFKGMKITDQSAHDNDTCRGDCGRLVWDETSYRSVSGARAVKLEDNPTHGRLSYTRASSQTLAVSHVWSHGQGGRPEVSHGFNLCLHRRYLSIARSLGCDSYWMDTPCIPEDHELRKEAILSINEVFERSKATVVYDRDLMYIDATVLSIKVREMIMVAVMVCDWNLRAWTFLEAFRGRENIYILCKNNVPVSLKETVKEVYHEGSIDIALLLLTIPHLLPAQIKRDYKTIGNAFVSGFMTVETSGSLLSHRAASRPGDDVIIWSLLLNDTVYNDAEAFWRSREGQTLSTSFLVSSAPRLKSRGLSWAPSAPTAQLLKDISNGSTARVLAYDGSESEVGSITKDGFLAKWFAYDFVGGLIGSQFVSSRLGIEIDPVDERCHINLSRIRQCYLRGFLWGILLRPVNSRTSREPAAHRGETGKTLLIICASNRRYQCPCEKQDQIPWHWRGIYEWDQQEPLPKFTLRKDTLIV